MAHFSSGGSGSQPGVPETSNSGALARAGFPAFCAADEAAELTDFVPAGPAPAAAALAASPGAGFPMTIRLGAGFGAAGAAVAVAGFPAAAGLAPAAGLALAEGWAALPRPSACSTEARKSTNMSSGEPEEYSA